MQHWYLTTAILFTLIVKLDGQAVEGRLLGSWSEPALIPSFAYNNTYNEVWGLNTAGREYAILGSTAGTHIIDITKPAIPKQAFLIEGGTTGGVIVHRDFHDYGGYLYAVADEGAESTLQIIDLAMLPDTIEIVYDSQQYIRRAHNIFIDDNRGYLYACTTAGAELGFAPLRIFDLADPTAPTPVGSYSRFGDLNVSQVHDAYVRNDIAFLNCGPHGLAIVDFTDKAHPVPIATLRPSEYPQSGYNHSGWPDETGRYYFMADETWGMDMKVLDLIALPDITIVDTIDAGSASTFSIAHNQIVKDDYLYCAYYYDGLQVYDISDMADIKRVMYYTTSAIPHRQSYEGAWGVYPFLESGNILVSDMQEGLFIIAPPGTVSAAKDQYARTKTPSVFPNPNAGQFTISGDVDAGHRLLIHTLSGQLMYDLPVSKGYDLQLGDGYYILTIAGAACTQSQPLIVKRNE